MVFSNGGAVTSAKNHMVYYPQGIVPLKSKTNLPNLDMLLKQKPKENPYFIRIYNSLWCPYGRSSTTFCLIETNISQNSSIPYSLSSA